ncbi:tRNA 2-thiouridine(34) synthase MnmA [Patescibacteria group bacterium]|nr:MAG: tRNA 2-thiouridine(34) synthase MnmA [Patescibacteria group bacterium]
METATRPISERRVLVGMSGGVDSSLAAALLLEQGNDVVGCFLKNWSDTKDESGACAWRSERRDALAVAAKLGIPLVTVDAEEVYRAAVVEPLYAEYAAGRTPNPDVRCNEFVKFPALAAEAKRQGCAWIATGHYAQVRHPSRAGAEGESLLLQAADAEKDQTYFLCRLPQKLLAQTLFPIGHLTKPQVRDEARRRGLPTAEKEESMGICFVGKVALPDFLRQRIPDAPGEIVSVDSAVLGRHGGVHRFTVGQRHGLGISAKGGSASGGGGGEPWYVVATDPASRRVVVSRNEQDLFSDQMQVGGARWIAATPALPARLGVRIRHRQEIVAAEVTAVGDMLRVRFSTPVRAITSGQAAVFYDGDVCLGGGVIGG